MIEYINNFLSFSFMTNSLLPLILSVLKYGVISSVLFIIACIVYIINNEKNSIVNLFAIGTIYISGIIAIIVIYVITLLLIFIPLLFFTILLKNMMLTVCTLPEVVVGVLAAFIIGATAIGILKAINYKK